MRMTAPVWACAHTSRPILVGPWTSEMGFEVLYWLPYLAYLRQTYRLEPDRLIAVTRGGAWDWYGMGHQVELYDYVPAGDLRLMALESSQRHQSINQHGITPAERRLVEYIAGRTGLRRYHWLHPSRMFQQLAAWWGPQTTGMAEAMKTLRFTPIPTPVVPVGMTVPDQFVACRWYQRSTWPLTEDLLDWTHALVRELAKTIPVVILASSQYADDHVDFPAPEGANITVIQAEPWRENLAIQSAILKRAKAFVGTWGGMAQLAVRLGIPTAAFYYKWSGASYAHLMLTQWLGVQSGVPVFVGRPQEAEFVRSVLPVAIAVPEPPRGSSS